MSDKKDLINPEEIESGSLKKITKKVKRNNDIVERSDEKIITDDGKELLT